MTITMQEISKEKGVIRKAALIHCRFFGLKSSRALDIRDKLLGPVTLNEDKVFWAEVDDLCHSDVESAAF